MTLNKFKQLEELGAGEFAHINGSLIEHLQGTHELLVAWEAPAHVADAGLYHAAYSTDGFESKLLDTNDRDRVAQIIGRRAEELVYLYCACDRAFVYPQFGKTNVIYRDRFAGDQWQLSDEALSQLVEIIMANELEICQRDPSFMDEHRDGFVSLFDRCENLVSEPAFTAYRKAFHGGS